MKPVFQHLFFSLVTLTISGVLTTTFSASLYKWVDQYGNVTYQDTPPPDNVEFEESELPDQTRTSANTVEELMEEAAVANPVSLYTVPGCDGCDLVRLFLERNSVPFAEINVRNNIPGQGELEKKTGSLEVPTLVIGDKILGGYSQSLIKTSLIDAGFPVDRVTDNASPNDLPDPEATESEKISIPGLDQTGNSES